MSTQYLHGNIARLRKSLNLTQEELARRLGVTNQTVSKWEGGVCCPDIALLPALAALFGVTLDELFGHASPPEELPAVYRRVRRLFAQTPPADCFDLAYKLAALLHEGAVTRGYTGYAHWDVQKERTADEDVYGWGYSACSEPEGATVMRAGGVMLASFKRRAPYTANTVRRLHAALRPYTDAVNLQVFFALYELTAQDVDLYIPAAELAERCRLPAEAVGRALDELPVQTAAPGGGEVGYRVAGSCMHLPALLSLLLPPDV